MFDTLLAGFLQPGILFNCLIEIQVHFNITSHLDAVRIRGYSVLITSAIWKFQLKQNDMQEVRFPSYLPFPFVNMVHRIRSCVLLPLNLLLFLVNFRKFVKHIGKSFLFLFLLSLDSLLTYCDFVFCSLRITRDDSRMQCLIINATLLSGSSEAQRSKSDFADSQSLSASCASPRRNHALAVSAFSSIALC